MINYVTIKIDVENINCMQSELLIGMPSLIAYMSFIENILIKSELKTSRPKEVFIGINKFLYRESYVKSSENIKHSKEISFNPINKMQKGELSTEICFAIDIDIENFVAEIKIKKVLNQLKFSGGIITSYSVYIRKEKKQALIKMFPTFIINADKEPINSLADILEKTLFTKEMFKDGNFEERNLVITGYNFLSDKIKSDDFKYDSVYGEPIYRLVKKEALTNKTLPTLNGWYWDIQYENKILIKQKGE